jgi:hypothetical protein
MAAASTGVAAARRSFNRRVLYPFMIGGGGALVGGGVYWMTNYEPRDTIGRASWAYYHMGTAARALVDAERSHEWAIKSLQWVR